MYKTIIFQILIQLIIAHISNMYQMAAFGNFNSGAVNHLFSKVTFICHYINAEDDEIIKI